MVRMESITDDPETVLMCRAPIFKKVLKNGL